MKSRYDELQTEYSSLKLEYEKLQEKFSTLLSDYEKLSNDFKELANKYSELSENYSSLKSAHSELLSKYEDLEAKCNLLQKDYTALLNRYNTLIAVAKERAGLIPQALPKYIDYTSSGVYEAVSEALSLQMDNPYAEIYYWIRSHVSYNYDTPMIIPNPPGVPDAYSKVYNYVQYAGETAKLKHGDYEDQAILAAAMILNYWLRTEGKTHPIYVVMINGWNGNVPLTHTFTIVPIEEGKVVIIDPAGAQRIGVNSWVFRIVEPEGIERAFTEYVKIWQDLGVEWDRVEAVFNYHEYIELGMDIDAFVKWLYKQTT